MKRLFATLLLTHLIFCAQAQQSKKEIVKVPPKVSEAFAVAHPRAEVTSWRTEGDYYKVTFRDANLLQVILYDTTGKVFRKETELDGKDIPPTINQYYRNTFPHEQGYKVWEIEDQNKTRVYSSSAGDQKVYFDTEGKYTRSEKNVSGQRTSTRK